MKFLILNESHIKQGTNNSVLEYTFPAGSMSLIKGQKLALSNLSMYYSTFNITRAYNNNVFQYVWFDGNTYDVLFPDGFYDIPMINANMYFVMLQNGHYLKSASGKNIYFIDYSINATTYGIELNCYLMNSATYPTNNADPALNFTKGKSVNGTPDWTIPSVGIVPIVRILSTNNFSKIIGFNAGIYPKDTTIANGVQTPRYVQTQAFLSATAPQVSPLSAYTVSCSLLDNNVAVPNNLLYSFAPSGAFGSQFTVSPNQLIFIDCITGLFSSFTISFTDQIGLPVCIQDPNFVILLAIISTDELSMKL